MRLGILLALLCLNGAVYADLIGHWPLDDPSASTTISDSVGNNDGVVSGSLTFQQTGVDTTTGNSVQFNGVDGKFTVTNNGSFDTAQTTLSMWFRPEWLAGERGSPCILFGIRTHSATRLTIGYGKDHGGLWTWSGTSGRSYTYTFTPNTWYHLFAVWDSDSATEKIYINGVLLGTLEGFSYGSTANLPIQIGSRDTDRFFQGSIDDVHFYNHAFSLTEVNNHFKALLANSLSEAQSLYDDSAANEGNTAGQYSTAVRANLLENINNAQSVHDDVNSTGGDYRLAQNTLLTKMKEFLPLETQKLYGEIIGSYQAWNPQWSITNAFDENTGSLVFTLLGQATAGIKLPEGQLPAVINRLRFFPTPGWESRVTESFFEASVDGVNWDTLYTISTRPAAGWNEVDLSANTVAYRYFRLNDPNAHIHMNEIEFYAFYTPQLVQVLNRPQNFAHNTADQVILAANLKAKHGELYEHNITYTLTAAPVNGVLKLNGAALTDGDSFTQKDINDGLLTFSDNASHNSDSFDFTVTDTLGQSLAESTFSIVLDTDNDGLIDTDEIAANTDWNNPDSDGDGETDGWEVANGTDPLENTLTPAVTAIEGENGLSASYYYGTFFSTSGFASKNPSKVDKVAAVNFSNGHWNNFATSDRRTNVGARFQGYLNVPVQGNYKFILTSDEGTKLYIDDIQVIDNDGLHNARQREGVINLSKGLHKFRCDYFQKAGRHSCLLQWEGPGRARQTVPAVYFFLSVPEHEALVESVDSDQDGLLDTLEALEGSDPQNPDTDGDKLLDGEEYHAVHGYKTNSLLIDTDNDHVSDYDEIFLYNSNPLIPDFDGTFTDIINILPKDTSSRLGRWEIVDGGDTVYAVDRRGALEYTVDITVPGFYRVDALVGQYLDGAEHLEMDLHLYVDGQFVGRSIQEVTADTTFSYLSTYLKPGSHTIRFFWENVYNTTTLQMKSIVLKRPGGPDADGNGLQDWLDHHMATNYTIDAYEATSKVSPAQVEGKGVFVSKMQSAFGDVKRATQGRWYADLNLNIDSVTNFSIDVEDGLKSINGSIEWVETDVIAENGNTITIKAGSSMLLNAVDDNSADTTTLTITVQDIATDYTVGPGNAMEYLFSTPGTYTIAALDSVFTVEVVGTSAADAPFIWRGQSRYWQWKDLDERVTLEATGMTFAPAVSGGYYLQRDEILEDIHIVARLGESGPIIETLPTKAFWIRDVVDNHVIVEILEDGSKYTTDTVFGVNIPEGMIIELRTISGVMFIDGSTRITITKDDFDELDQWTLEMIRSGDRPGSNCHWYRVFQNGILVGR